MPSAVTSAVEDAWRRTLPDGDPQQSFFELGGTSLLAVQLAAELTSALGRRVPVRLIFDNPRPEALSLALLGLPASSHADESPVGGRLEPDDAADAPASYAQERIWATEHFWPVDGAYNDCLACEIQTELSPSLLNACIARVVARHAILRTRFALVGTELRQLVADIQPPLVDVIDLRMHDPERARALVADISAAKVHEPFDLHRGGLLRVTLYRLPTGATVLQLVTHHIVSDGWSFGNLFEELSTTYRLLEHGDAPSAALPPAQYADYARWQRKNARRDAEVADEEWWMAGLADVPQLPLVARPNQRSFRGARVAAQLDAEVASALPALLATHQVTPFMLFLAAYHLVLARWLGVRDFVIGTAVVGRELPIFHSSLGCFINMIPIRFRSESSEALGAVLANVRETALEALEHQAAPIERIARRFNSASLGRGDALLDASLVMDGMPVARDEFAGAPCTPYRFPVARAKFALTLYVTKTGGTWQADLEHMEEVVSATDAARVVEETVAVVGQIVREPERAASSIVQRRDPLATGARAAPSTAREEAATARSSSSAEGRRSGEHDPASCLQALSAVVTEILGVPAVSPDDTLLGLGGHSMHMLALVARIEDAWQYRFALEDVLTCSIADLAGLLACHGRGTADGVL